MSNNNQLLIKGGAPDCGRNCLVVHRIVCRIPHIIITCE